MAISLILTLLQMLFLVVKVNFMSWEDAQGKTAGTQKYNSLNFLNNIQIHKFSL